MLYIHSKAETYEFEVSIGAFAFSRSTPMFKNTPDLEQTRLIAKKKEALFRTNAPYIEIA